MTKSASSSAVTLKVTATEWDSKPFTAVTNTWLSPGVANVHDRVDVSGPVSFVGLSEQDVLLLVRSTTPAKWFIVVMVIVEFAGELTSVEDAAGFAAIAKSEISTVTSRECVKGPLVPITVAV